MHRQENLLANSVPVIYLRGPLFIRRSFGAPSPYHYLVCPKQENILIVAIAQSVLLLEQRSLSRHNLHTIDHPSSIVAATRILAVRHTCDDSDQRLPPRSGSSHTCRSTALFTRALDAFPFLKSPYCFSGKVSYFVVASARVDAVRTAYFEGVILTQAFPLLILTHPWDRSMICRSR